jgi:hypothetical protein
MKCVEYGMQKETLQWYKPCNFKALEALCVVIIFNNNYGIQLHNKIA